MVGHAKQIPGYSYQGGTHESYNASRGDGHVPAQPGISLSRVKARGNPLVSLRVGAAVRPGGAEEVFQESGKAEGGTMKATHISGATIERELCHFEAAIKQDGMPFNPEYLWATMKQFEGEMTPPMLLSCMVVASATEHPGFAARLTDKQFRTRLSTIQRFLRLVARAGWIRLAEHVLEKRGTA